MNLLALLSLVVIGPVDSDAVERVSRAAVVAQISGQPLLVLLDGGGGSVQEGGEIIAALEKIPRATCYVADEAASMSAQIFVAAHCHRVMRQGAKLLFHLPHADIRNATYVDLTRYAGQLEAVSRAVCEQIEYGTSWTVPTSICLDLLVGLPPGEFWEVSATAALHLHMVDEVVP